MNEKNGKMGNGIFKRLGRVDIKKIIKIKELNGKGFGQVKVIKLRNRLLKILEWNNKWKRYENWGNCKSSHPLPYLL